MVQIANTSGAIDPHASAGQVPIWREPVRGAYPDPRLFQLSGMDQLRCALSGRWPRPPMAHLAGLVFTHADEVSGEIEQPAAEWFLSSQGVVPGGFLAVIADCALSVAIMARLPARTPFMTSEISMNFVRPATTHSRVIKSRAKALHVGDELALAECVVEEAGGAILAHGSTRCLVQDQLPQIDLDESISPIGGIEEAMAAIPVPHVPRHEQPSPYERPVEGQVLSRETWEGRAGREILEEQMAGNLPMPPIHHLTGMRPTRVGDGEATFAMPCTAWLTSAAGRVLGGFSAMLAYSALASAIQTTTDPDTAHVPVDLKINFLRPLYPDAAGRDLVAHGAVVHSGRTLRVADAEVYNPDGKLVAVARGTSMLLPGQPAWTASLRSSRRPTKPGAGPRARTRTSLRDGPGRSRRQPRTSRRRRGCPHG
jgi:uncharacterized protein (TIGR00369 family)